MTPNPDFNGRPLFDGQYLEIHSYNGILYV